MANPNHPKPLSQLMYFEVYYDKHIELNIKLTLYIRISGINLCNKNFNTVGIKLKIEKWLNGFSPSLKINLIL